MRFSTPEQGQGSSLIRQQIMLDKWLTDHPAIPLSNLSVQDLGKSGYSGANLGQDAGLGQILTAISDGLIVAGDYLIVEAIDRLSRLDFWGMFGILQKIIGAGVKVVTLDDGMVYDNNSVGSDASGVYVLVAKAQQAHQYSKNLSRRLIAANENKRSKARAGESIRMLNSWWLDTSGKLIPDRAAFMREMVGLYLEGKGYTAIIHAMGPRYDSDNKLRVITVKKWLSAHALYGAWESSDGVIPDVFEPVIDKDTWLQVQQIRQHKSKQRGPNATYSVTGLVGCGVCGRNMHIRAKKRPYGTYYIAICANNHTMGSYACTHNASYPLEVLEYVLKQTAGDALAMDIIDADKSDSNKRALSLNAEIGELSKQVEKLIDLLLTVDSVNVKDRLHALETKRKALQAELAKVELTATNSAMTEAELEAAIIKIDSDPDYRRMILQKVGYRLMCKDGEITAFVGDKSISYGYKLFNHSKKYGAYIVERQLHKRLFAINNKGECIATGLHSPENWREMIEENMTE